MPPTARLTFPTARHPATAECTELGCLFQTRASAAPMMNRNWRPISISEALFAAARGWAARRRRFAEPGFSGSTRCVPCTRAVYCVDFRNALLTLRMHETEARFVRNGTRWFALGGEPPLKQAVGSGLCSVITSKRVRGNGQQKHHAHVARRGDPPAG